MSELPPVVVDTNIVFSALLSGSSTFADLLLTSNYRFYVCELVVVELFKQKDKLIRVSRLSEDEIVRVLYILLRHLHLYKEDFHCLSQLSPCRCNNLDNIFTRAYPTPVAPALVIFSKPPFLNWKMAVLH